MVKYHPWHYEMESSDKTFFHTGENYHYSFNYLSTGRGLTDYMLRLKTRKFFVQSLQKKGALGFDQSG